MSGPKRGSWRFSYDPTPEQLDDLSHFAAKQDAWLRRNGGFIRRYLGNEALERAQAARDVIDDCIAAGDPDDGFDAYGEAWDLFNQLRREATRAKHLEQERRRRKQLRQQRDAAKMLAECNAIWQDQDTQALLLRWARPREHKDMASALQALGNCPTHKVTHEAQAWRRRLEYLLNTANSRAQENAKAVAACVPQLRSAVQRLGELDLSVLGRGE
ncbi:MAG: hypothetical protein JSV03_02585, partial [Planctomycetota bacterium]